MKKLVIVESPTKARKIRGFLSKALPSDHWNVVATSGHFMDLPKKSLGVDVTNGFKMSWVCTNRAVRTRISDAAILADQIYICTDPDREGEGIAQQVFTVVSKKLDAESIYRATFTEISQEAVVKAITTPGKLSLSTMSTNVRSSTQTSPSMRTSSVMR